MTGIEEGMEEERLSQLRSDWQNFLLEYYPRQQGGGVDRDRYEKGKKDLAKHVLELK